MEQIRFHLCDRFLVPTLWAIFASLLRLCQTTDHSSIQMSIPYRYHCWLAVLIRWRLTSLLLKLTSSSHASLRNIWDYSVLGLNPWKRRVQRFAKLRTRRV